MCTSDSIRYHTIIIIIILIILWMDNNSITTTTTTRRHSRRYPISFPSKKNDQWMSSLTMVNMETEKQCNCNCKWFYEKITIKKETVNLFLYRKSSSFSEFLKCMSSLNKQTYKSMKIVKFGIIINGWCLFFNGKINLMIMNFCVWCLLCFALKVNVTRIGHWLYNQTHCRQRGFFIIKMLLLMMIVYILLFACQKQKRKIKLSEKNHVKNFFWKPPEKYSR